MPTRTIDETSTSDPQADAPISPIPCHDESAWLAEMKWAYRDAAALLQRLKLPASLAEGAQQPADSFPLFAPRSFVQRMRSSDPKDPLLRQVLPSAEEAEVHRGFTDDPVADADFAASPGIIRKYAGRALLIATGSCAVHCRYCFRRHFPYSEAPRSLNLWRESLQALSADSSLNELILSGGDPLTLRDLRLGELLELVSQLLPDLKRLRIHTRLPVVIPQRVTAELIELLASRSTRVVVVLHVNHANEIDRTVCQAIDALRSASVMLLNQAVLLRGVNDTLVSQVDLSERLLEVGVMPYYLHQLDRVAGAAHYECDVRLGETLIEQMRGRLPGYAVPRFVRDDPGMPSKSWLA